MITELDETIRQILIQEGGLQPSEVDVSFDIPDREWSAGISKPTLNCYLFDIRENRDMQQAGVHAERHTGNGVTVRRRPPLRLDLTYLITAWTRAVEDEHRLLWHALTTLLHFTVLPSEHLQGNLREHTLPIYSGVARFDGVLKSPGEFWTALENQLKPSLSFVITLAVNRDTLPAGPPVLTRTTRYTRTSPKNEARWRGIRYESAVPFAMGTSIGGVVRNKQGEPLKEVSIGIEGSAAQEVLTDDEGRFVLHKVTSDTLTLRVARDDGKPVRVKVTVPSPSYDIVLD